MATSEKAGTELDVLVRIDTKLAALLALSLDTYLRSAGVKRTKERSVDRMLVDSGLPASTVARLLGKTERAVHLALQRESKKKRSNKTRTKRAASRK